MSSFLIEVDMFDKVAWLLSQARALVEKNSNLFLDASTLTDYVTAMELAQEVETLNNLLTEDKQNFPSRFREQAIKRATCNRDSSLSLVADPTGFCNQLYWNIAKLLVKEEKQTFGNMLSVLQPEITTFIELEFYFENNLKKPKIQDAKIRLYERPITELTTIGEANDLTNFVVYKSCLFDVRKIANLNFPLQQTFFRTLKESYPEFVSGVYRHNRALIALHEQLQWLDGAGKKPREAISALREKFVAGGESITGATYATAAANQAFHKDFLGYLEALPVTFRENLLAATTKNGISLRSIVNALHDGECVEVTSTDLKAILKNPANKEVLDSNPYWSHEAQKALESQYAKTSLLTMREREAGILPAYYLSQIFNYLEIYKVDVCVNLLLVCPPSFYATLLREVQFYKFYALELAITLQSALTEAQHLALSDALFVSRDNLGVENVFIFAICSNYQNLLRQLLRSIDSDQRLNALHHFDTSREKILELLFLSPEALEIVIQELPVNDRMKFYIEKNHKGIPFLHEALFTESMPLLLDNLPKEHAFEIIMQKDNNGNTALHYSAFSEQRLSRLLQAIPEAKRLEAIREKNQQGKTLLSFVKGSSGQIRVILQALPNKGITEEKLELYFIIGTLISNIETGVNRRTSGVGAQKVRLLCQIQDQLLDGGDKEVTEFMRDVLSICHIKRHAIHFWAQPDSVNEFLEMAREKNLPRPETEEPATRFCFWN
ncbi:hypothetical protein SAMN02746073_1106 [Legionella jamestowniensis DSM 19215]|uniref:Ankyrin repeats (3 copies) n=2 Tax=Legionella jamestowniensis TaxID=455 RepID=A0A0W0UIQ2_9GAMM|nr:hypothetical protein Ljam_1982 [Legionella jamestowniensis]SFL62179.1 hypothetical protein SAMN02746073_1106 [Legionella jamestowniensis DSM 19215]